MSGLKQRIETALKQDSGILVEVSKIAEAEGVTLEYMEELGIRKSDLKKLETNNMALRGYLPREFEGFTGRRKYRRGKHKKRYTYPVGKKHAGFQVKWMLLTDRK